MKYLYLLLCCLVLSSYGYSKELNIKEESLFYMRGEVDSSMATSVAVFVNKMKLLKKHEADILIDSPGGSVLDGAAILDSMKGSKIKFRCVVNTLAASMAAVILEYCDGRYATNNSIIMFHNASGTFQGDFAIIAARFGALTRYVDKMDEPVAKRLSLSLAEYKSKTNTEWWLVGAADAKLQKVIDDEAVLTIQPAFPSGSLEFKIVPKKRFPGTVDLLDNVDLIQLFKNFKLE